MTWPSLIELKFTPVYGICNIRETGPLEGTETHQEMSEQEERRAGFKFRLSNIRISLLAVYIDYCIKHIKTTIFFHP